MKIRVINRDESDMVRATANDIVKVHRNPNPNLHPFQQPREYVRAVNSAKLNRIFAKPFMGALSGHSDGIYCMARHHQFLNALVSGACDGEIKLWNVSQHAVIGDTKPVASWKGHQGFVRGLTFSWDGSRVYSCGVDKTLQLWSIPQVFTKGMSEEVTNAKLLHTWLHDDIFRSMDHQRNSDLIGTASTSTVEIWDPNRTEPYQTLSWKQDTINTIRFHPTERDIICTTADDYSIVLYDLSGNTPISKVVLKRKSNSISWNPRNPLLFTVANEDHNLYTFDMRKLGKAMKVHEGHVSAVISVDYSPTGMEFVSGSYDRTIRLFNNDILEGKFSKEIYSAKRMQKIFSCIFSGDGQYIYAGSDDTNIRVWKADASRNIALTTRREKRKQVYREALLERYKNFPQIKEITRRHQPKQIHNLHKIKRIIEKKRERKRLNFYRSSLNEEQRRKRNANFRQDKRKTHIIGKQK